MKTSRSTNPPSYLLLTAVLLIIFTASASAQQPGSSSPPKQLQYVANQVIPPPESTEYLPEPQSTIPLVTPTPTASNSLLPRPDALEADCASWPFHDIGGGTELYDATEYMYCRSNVSGTAPLVFSPDAPITRAQFARADVLNFGLALTSSGGPHFTDVPPSYYAYIYIETAYINGIVSGYDIGTCSVNHATYPCFLPERNILRGEMAKLLSQSASYYDSDVSGMHDFTDVPIGGVFHDVIERIFVHHVTTGATNCSPTPCYNINGLTKRSEMALFIYRAVHQPFDGRNMLYARAAAVKYADTWTSNTDGARRNPAYRPFNDNDCTNFASQIRVAGGIPQVYGDPNQPANWYYSNENDYSRSWPLTDVTNSHFTLHTERFQTEGAAYALFGGDIILFHLPEGAPGWNHARNVVGYGAVSPTSPQPAGTRGLLVSQHSADRFLVTWDYNVPPSVQRVYWHVIY